MFFGYLKRRIHSQGANRPISEGISLQPKSTGSINFSPEGTFTLSGLIPPHPGNIVANNLRFSKCELQLRAVVTSERKCSYLEASKRSRNHPQHLRTHMKAGMKSMQEGRGAYGHVYVRTGVSVTVYVTILGTHGSDYRPVTCYTNNNLLHLNMLMWM